MLIAAESEQAYSVQASITSLNCPSYRDKVPWDLPTCGNLLGSLSVIGEQLGKEPGFGLCILLAHEMATWFSKPMASHRSGEPKKLHGDILRSLPSGLYVQHSYASLSLNYF